MKLLSIIAGGILACALAACGGSGGGGVKPVQSYAWDGNGDEVVLENEQLLLRFIPQTAEVILLDKARGTEWRSNPAGGGEDPRGTEPARLRLQSQFSLVYRDIRGTEAGFTSYNESVKEGRYEYAVKDGGLEVDYFAAHAGRTYRFPVAAPESRMKVFLERMPQGDRARTEGAYTAYSLQNLPISGSPSKGYLLRTYPDIANERVYVLKPTVADFLKADLEEAFRGAAYTAEDYEVDLARYPNQAVAETASFNLTIRYELRGGSLLVSVPFDRIAYRQAYPLTGLSLLPFFGAGGPGDEGYIIVPDGSGALIRFNNGRESQQGYNGPVYGFDAGTNQINKVSLPAAPFPVYGIEKNGAALLAVIEEGASYATVIADVAGRVSSWNEVSPEFALIHNAGMDVSGRGGRENNVMRIFEPGLPDERILMRFTPCAENGYVGMAKEYRAYLLDNYPALGKGAPGTVPAAVEILGAVGKTQHILGIPADRPFKLTSYQEAAAMIRDFSRRGWRDLAVKLTGWFNGGIDHRVPNSLRLVDELGGGGGFPGLLAAAREGGYRLYGEADFTFLRKGGLFDGFNLNEDGARFITRNPVRYGPLHPATLNMQLARLAYLGRPAYTVSLARSFADKAAAAGVGGLAFRNIGAKLGADYRAGDRTSREAAARLQENLLAELREQGTGIMIQTGFSYAAPRADLITGMALTSQEYGIADADVPFYQIALHGLVPYTGKAVNLAEDYTKHLLKTVETGAGLYFSFMAADGSVLQESRYKDYYANEYAKWIDEADGLYRRFVRDFTGLYAQTIEDHETLAPAFTVTRYSGGAEVLVNAGKQPAAYKGIVVPPNDYAVIR